MAKRRCIGGENGARREQTMAEVLYPDIELICFNQRLNYAEPRSGFGMNELLGPKRGKPVGIEALLITH